MSSSILKLFSKEHYEPKDPNAPPMRDEDCLPCLGFSAAFMTGGGAYLATGLVFRTKDGRTLPNVTPAYRASVRIGGAAVMLFGVYRAWQAWEVYKSVGSSSQL